MFDQKQLRHARLIRAPGGRGGSRTRLRERTQNYARAVADSAHGGFRLGRPSDLVLHVQFWGVRPAHQVNMNNSAGHGRAGDYEDASSTSDSADGVAKCGMADTGEADQLGKLDMKEHVSRDNACSWMCEVENFAPERSGV
ncbi:hypothetical protein PpBr36_02019 [Pyricularia pennisetigena]|uniref:hypothetical protein n=1 Tax=Pyricularia pennisetigena TaxID=1578925 RepID=UPI001153EE49|nr:hypothetical protein PpBr36_02019 [Pyricularia pennisetigena]TLS29064.1 hypothetical protein PpBr36_02019 [Pyricularia pennisetigena]